MAYELCGHSDSIVVKLEGCPVWESVMKKKQVSTTLKSLFASLLMTSAVASQPLDPLSGEGAEFSAALLAMLMLGIEQGIIENCGVDVEPNVNRLVEFYDAVRSTGNDSYADFLAGMFGSGMRLSSDLGCDVDLLRSYGSWAEYYYSPALSQFTR